VKLGQFAATYNSVKLIYEHGLPAGSKTGWSCVDELYRPGAGALSIVTGMPNSGKSAWLDSLMVNLLRQPCNSKPWRFMVCSPEQEPEELHQAEILERYTGKRFREGAGRRMEWEEADEALMAMNDRIILASFEDRDTYADLIGEATGFAMICAERDMQAGIILDPWNRLEHKRPSHFSETEYIGEALTQAVGMTRKTGAHMWIVAHPHMMARAPNGKRPIPTPYDISSSAHWYNKPDNCLTVYRDMTAERGSIEAKEVQVHVQKIRWRHQGSLGVATLHFDYATGRYTDPGAAEEYRMRAA